MIKYVIKGKMKLDKFKNKKILILGFGREGIDNFKFLRKLFPGKTLAVGDKLEFKKLDKKTQKLLKSDKKTRLHLGKSYLKNLKNYDIILKTPGIPLRTIKKVKNTEIISQTEIFLENCPGMIVGVTGTKGKSTTASLTYEILKKAGFKVHLVGNIGKPVLSLLSKAKKNDIYVYELSSHQLVNVKKSPQIAVFLNVFPEHLDYYRNFREYTQVKGNITKFQTKNDYLVFNKEDKIVKEISKKSKAKKAPFNLIKLEKIIKVKDIPLKGSFNFQNVKAAIAVGKIFNISDKLLASAIKKFKPLPHRLEFVGKYKRIKFYNDALSTIPEATIGAIDALGNNIQTIMLGGFERNTDFTELAKKVLKSKIKTVILFPTTGKRIWNTIEKEARKLKIKKLPSNFFTDNMKDAVRLAYKYTKKEKICLLSTASSSFSIFKNYKEKGDLFKKYIKKFSYEKKS